MCKGLQWGFMVEKRKAAYVLIVLLFTAAALTFRPGLWLIHKPANSQNASYVSGWESGCISGTNSYSLLYAPLLDKPFIKEMDTAPGPGKQANASAGKDNYKTGWNEGFTLCRYYQSSVYELMQFAMIIATLLYIGYLVAKKKSRD